MTDKTDADFIAEYEAAPLGAVAKYNGVPIILAGGMAEMLSEAIERLKRAKEHSLVDVASERTTLQLKLLERSMAHEAQIEEKDKEIAELKELLRYLWMPGHVNPELGIGYAKRIEEILKQSES